MPKTFDSLGNPIPDLNQAIAEEMARIGFYEEAYSDVDINAIPCGGEPPKKVNP